MDFCLIGVQCVFLRPFARGCHRQSRSQYLHEPGGAAQGRQAHRQQQLAAVALSSRTSHPRSTSRATRFSRCTSATPHRSELIHQYTSGRYSCAMLCPHDQRVSMWYLCYVVSMYNLMNASKLARIASEEGTMTYITARIAAHTT